MPIRFSCRACGQTLAIARRKAGTCVACPKCGQEQIVPPEAGGNDAPGDSNGDESVDLSEVTVYVEVSPGVRPPPRQHSPQASPTSAPWRSHGEDSVLLPRRTLYVQAALILVAGLLGLGMGYLIGHQLAEADRPMAGGPSGERVLVEGRLLYRDRDGRAIPDVGAVVVLWPESRHPADRIPAMGIRPEDPPPRQGSLGMRRLDELGGAYARADGQGLFSAVLPEGGRYQTLVISAKTYRGEGAMIEPVDRDELARCFDHPEDLIGRHKYHLLVREFQTRGRVEHDFGRGG